MMPSPSSSYSSKTDEGPYNGCKYSKAVLSEDVGGGGDDDDNDDDGHGSTTYEMGVAYCETMDTGDRHTRAGDDGSTDSTVMLGKENGITSLDKEEEEENRGGGDCHEKINPETLRWGWGSWTLECLQRFNSAPWLLVALCAVVFFQGMTVSGLTGSCATSIERRFQLRSQDYGFLVSIYEATQIIFILFVAFIGGRGHKPKWISIGCLIMGVGSLLFALPHFTTDAYENFHDGGGDPGVCEKGRDDVINEHCQDGATGDDLTRYIYVFGVAQVLLALGSIPVYLLGIATLDESVTVKNNGVYLGMFYAMGTLGPGVGYVIAGLCLTLYTDINLQEGVELTDEDPGWVGAWWIGFVLAGFCILLIAIPVGAFPRELPTTAKIRLEKECQAHANAGAEVTARPSFGSRPADLLKAIKYLIVNPTFMCTSLAGCSDSLMITAFGVFLPKFIENQFATTATVATTIVGTCIVPGGVGGVLFGGWVIRRFRLRVVGTLKFCLLMTIMTIITAPALFLRCPQNTLAGVLVSYDQDVTSSERFNTEPNLTHACNSECLCSTNQYIPVCLEGRGLEFFSPCYAGCTDDYKNGTYSNCTCVEYVTGGASSIVTAGKCSSDCFTLPIFVTFLIIILVVLFMPMVPSAHVTLRCVPESQRAMALGFQSMIARCLGSIPGPILFGMIIDSTCLQWQETCNKHGSCWLYHNESFAWRLVVLACTLKITCGFLYAIAWWSYRPGLPAPQRKDSDYKHDT